MATANDTDTLDRATRRATVRQLADEEQLSARAIARRLGIGKDTVRRDLDATAPTLPQEAPESKPPAPTSGAPRAPRLLYDLGPAMIQDLNVLMDSRTGALIEPVRRYLRAAANARRADMRAVVARICTEDE